MITTTQETITPEIATEWLKKNKKNRPMQASRTEGLANDMKSGNWILNGEAVKFGEDGNLKDGQHRLQACVLAEAPFQTLVVRGLSSDAQQTMDQGKQRTLVDVMTLERDIPKDPSKVASITKTTFLFQKNTGTFNNRLANGANPTIAEYLEWFDAHESALKISADMVTNWYGKRTCAFTATDVNMIAFAAVNNGLIAEFDNFMEALATGILSSDVLRPDDARFLLRKFFLGIQRDKNRQPTTVYRRQMAHYAWNKWIGGDSARQLKPIAKGQKAWPIRDQAGTALFPINFGKEESDITEIIDLGVQPVNDLTFEETDVVTSSGKGVFGGVNS